MSKLTLKTDGDVCLVGTRRFAAPPEAIYRASTEAEFIQQWLLGSDGWTMPVCVCDTRPGGQFRYEWSDGSGGGFRMTGEFIEVVPFRKVVHVQRMYMPDPTPYNRVERTFEADGDGTLLTIRMTVADTKTRDAMLGCNMEQGMEAGYARLDKLTSAQANVENRT